MRATLILAADPFHPARGRQARQLTRPRRIRALAPRTSAPHLCLLNGRPLPRAAWARRLRHGDVAVFVLLPRGGGGGGGKNPLSTVLSIASIIYTGGIGETFAGFLSEAGIIGSMAAFEAVKFAVNLGGLVGGALLSNSQAGTPRAPTPQVQAELAAPSPTYSLQAQGNAARLGSPVPVLYGRHMVYPPYASQPFTEYQGNEQYLYQLFALTLGECDVEAVRIEDTPIETYQDVTWRLIRPGEAAAALFHPHVAVAAEVIGQEVLQGAPVGPFNINAAGSTAQQLGWDIVFPRGLYYYGAGGIEGRSAKVRVQARPVDDDGNPLGGWLTLSSATETLQYSHYWSHGYWQDDGQGGQYWVQDSFDTPTASHVDGVDGWRWLPYGSGFPEPERNYQVQRDYHIFSAASTTELRYSYRASVASGRWQMQAERLDAKDGSANAGHEVRWAQARAYLDGPSSYNDRSLLAVVMRATNQLSGLSSRKINVIATRRLPVWNGATWSAPQPTRAIAWAIADLARASYGGRLSDARLNLAALLALDAVWTARGDTFDAVYDNRLNLWEALEKCARAGRAKPYQQGGILGVARDGPAGLAVQVYSMRNIVRNSLTLSYELLAEDAADSVRLNFFNAATWRPKDITLTLPGGATERPASVDLFGVTGQAQAQREGLYVAAHHRYRRRRVKFETEMEGFIPAFGDVIAITHDLPAWGQSGDIRDYDPATRTLTVSEPLDTTPGAQHYIVLRRADGSPSGPHACTPLTGGDGRLLQLTTDPFIADPALTIASAAAQWGPGGPAAQPPRREATHYAFGAGATWATLAKVDGIRPRASGVCEISATPDDPRVHTADGA